MAVTTIEKESYMLYRGWNPLFESLPKEQLGELFYAICCYQSGKEYKIENQFVKGVFEMVLMQFQKDEANYKEKCEIRAKNGKKGAENRWQDNSKCQTEENTEDSENGKNGKCHSEDGKNGKCYFSHTEKKSEMAKMAIEEEDEEEEEEEDEEKEEDILPPYNPPKGGEADSSLRSESRQNIDGYTPPKPERTDYQGVLDAYHECCPSFPAVIKLTETRKRAIKARLKDYGLDEIKRAFSLAGQSDFLKGSSGWQASFDWLMKPANMTKVLEGNYTNRASPAGGKSQSMWGEDDFVAKVIRGETSLAEEGWFNGMGKVVDERGNPA